MIVAILGNGPSREDYYKLKETRGYSHVVSCNFPWTDVDYNTIIDMKAAQGWIDQVIQNKQINPVRLFLSPNASKKFVAEGQSAFLQNWKQGDVEVRRRESSAHVAVKAAIQYLHATQIDIFGIDTFYTMDNTSTTWKYVNGGTDGPHRAQQISDWRQNWHRLKEENPNVRMEMIRLDGNYSLVL
jgi:hypothetical protein